MRRRSERFEGRIDRTIADSESWWPPRPEAPADAPNVVVILLDDMGFSDVGCFGSEIETPAIDGLAEEGVRYSSFHVAASCSPTRASLLSGINHHRAGYATVAMSDPGVPNRSMEFRRDTATLPEVLRENGYATFALGKWHLAPEQEMHDAGDRSMWPCQVGFDRFYGILEGVTTLHNPHRIVVDNSPLEVDSYPEGYYLTDDLTDQAIKMIQTLRANEPEKPFFLYMAHPAPHAPLQAKPEDMEVHRGRYADGWDAVRARRFERQLELGLFPSDSRLPPRNPEPGWDVQPWEDVPPDNQALAARLMEAYAGMITAIDRSTARLIAAIEALGELDNTIVIFFSDNGADGMGGERGLVRYTKDFPMPRPQERVSEVERDVDLVGGPRSLVHYPRGWAMVGNTPFRLYKAKLFEGGVHSPLIVSWPARLRGRVAGEVRHQYQYVTDVMPTIFDLAGIEMPTERDGRPLQSLDGRSFARSLLDPGAPARSEQHAESSGDRSFYKDGWKVVTLHQRMTPFSDEEWELYHIERDPTELDELSEREPEKLAELAAGWEAAAQANDVYPMDEGSGYGFVLRNPADSRFTSDVTLLPGTPTLERYRSSRLTAWRSFVVDIAFEQTDGAEGVLVAHGDQGGGYSVYVEGGRLRAAYNEYGDLFELEGAPLAAGSHAATFDLECLPAGRCNVRVTLNGDECGRLDDALMLFWLAPFEGIDVGIDRRSPVSWPVYERHGPFPYSGSLGSVTYRPGELASDAPELRLEAMRTGWRKLQ